MRWYMLEISKPLFAPTTKYVYAPCACSRSTGASASSQSDFGHSLWRSSAVAFTTGQAIGHVERAACDTCDMVPSLSGRTAACNVAGRGQNEADEGRKQRRLSVKPLRCCAIDPTRAARSRSRVARVRVRHMHAAKFGDLGNLRPRAAYQQSLAESQHAPVIASRAGGSRASCSLSPLALIAET